MKKQLIYGWILAVCMLLSVSCMSHTTPVEVMDGFHTQMNKGAIGNALSYVAKDAVFEIDASPIAGSNGMYKGRAEIRLWLNKIASREGQTSVSGMSLNDEALECFLEYEDNALHSTGLHEIMLFEDAVVQNGFIQSYTLTMFPETQDRIDVFKVLKLMTKKGVDSSDLKFYHPDTLQ